MSWVQNTTGVHPFDDMDTVSQVPQIKPIANRVLAAVQGMFRGRRSGVVRLVGVPGCGRTMVAQRVAQACRIVDGATRDEVATIYRASGLGVAGDASAWDVPVEGAASAAYPSGGRCWVPFRVPHHTVSVQGIVGAGPRPGEVHLAHGGILVLDNPHEFSRAVQIGVLSALRLGDVVMHTQRRSGCASGWGYPSRFVCITLENPCPCGWAGLRERKCVCAESARKGHAARNLIAQSFPDAPVFDFQEARLTE